MVAQQGILLCKLFHEAYFSVTLMNMTHRQVPDRPVLRKMKIDVSLRREFLEKLQAKGITERSLFPDCFWPEAKQHNPSVLPSARSVARTRLHRRQV
jgi:hypothetical protein